MAKFGQKDCPGCCPNCGGKVGRAGMGGLTSLTCKQCHGKKHIGSCKAKPKGSW